LLDRLKINNDKIDGMIKSVKEVALYHDPEGNVLFSHIHENGIHIENKTCPFGKILIIYESRPDVTIEASILSFKSGNKTLLKGGKESINTNRYLASLWHQALEDNNCNIDYITYIDLNREDTQELIKH
jgi:glutamate-5-semialdehyde dehydrogenase